MEGTAALYAALAAAQGKLKNPEKTKEAVVKGKSKATGRAFEMRYKYADIADVLNAVRPVLAREGLSVAQHTRVTDAQYLFVDTILMHEQGGAIRSEFPVCPVVTDQQKMGGSLTYARRYALCSLLGIAAEEDIDRADQVQEAFESGSRQAPPLPNQAPASQAGTAPDFPEDPAEVAPVSYDDQDIRAWAAPFANALKKADTVRMVEDWFNQNENHLGALQGVAPKLHDRIQAIRSQRISELTPDEKEQ